MCEFCEEGNKIKAEYKGNGITTARNTICSIFGYFNEDAFNVAYIENGKMFVDNSSGEYAELGFKINYCPFCGKEVKGEENENQKTDQRA